MLGAWYNLAFSVRYTIFDLRVDCRPLTIMKTLVLYNEKPHPLGQNCTSINFNSFFLFYYLLIQMYKIHLLLLESIY